MPGGPAWKLPFPTHLQFRKHRNCRIQWLLFGVRSKEKKSKLWKSQAAENREGKHSQKKRRASPHRSSPSAQFGGCCPPTRSHSCRHKTRSHLARRKALSYSRFPADPPARDRAESRAMRFCFRMLPWRRCHPRGASSTGSPLHPNIYISCFLPGCI